MSKKATVAEERPLPRPAHQRELLIDLYEHLLLPRLIEEKMLLLLRQGRISKWFSGIGQEAIAVGSTKAMHSDEYILPLHRNLGVFTARGVPLTRLFLQFQGRAGGFTKGRDRSFHFGTKEYHIVGMISHLGPQLAVADGIALAHKLRKENKATLVFCGDGGTSQGDFHEALNVAAVWELPVIFLIENNGYGLSTPVNEQYRCRDLVDRAIGYGMEGHIVDGNDVLAVYNQVHEAAQSIRQKARPVLIECKTFRMRGHEEASGIKYVPPELIERWAARDPVSNYEKQILAWGDLDSAGMAVIKGRIKSEIDIAVEEAFAAVEITPDCRIELRDVYREHSASAITVPRPTIVKRRFVDAVSEGLKLAMQKHQNLIFMGQDIAEYGGVFKVSEGFVGEFGAERVRNTPLCESAILGAAIGLSLEGFKSVVEMQFGDFVSSGFTQVVNNMAKLYYRWGQNVDVVVRLPCGAGAAAGPFHSQTNEIWFAHTPGLKVVYPSSAYDAKGLLIAAIEDPNPVMYFEHKALYRSITEEIPQEYYSEIIGKGKIVRSGEDCTIVTYGAGVHWAKSLADKRPEISIEIVDLRSLVPLDCELIFESVKKTNRLLVLHEDTLFAGIGGEISALVTSHCFEYLDAPIERCASLDTPVPFASALEKDFLANSRLEAALQKLIEY